MFLLQPSNEGFGDFGENFFKKIGRMNINMLKKTANPLVMIKNVKKEGFKRGMATTGNALINPLSVSGEKVMVGSYNIAGTRALKKTISGAVTGFATGGPYGAVAGAAAANLKKGKENIAQSALIGAAAGLAVGAATGTGAGGALTAGGSGTSYASGAASILGKVVDSKKQTNGDGYEIDPEAYTDAALQQKQLVAQGGQQNIAQAGMINPRNIILFMGLGAFTYAMFKIYDTRSRK